MGPMVWELEGPGPILRNSKKDVSIAITISHVVELKRHFSCGFKVYGGCFLVSRNIIYPDFPLHKLGEGFKIPKFFKRVMRR
jgi:hypothetical protein